MSWILGFPFKSAGDITTTTEYSDNLDVVNVVEDIVQVINIEDDVYSIIEVED